MIQIKQASKDYKTTLALDNIDLEISGSGIYCLLGRNGAGKTTLLKSIAGHINLTSGEIHVAGGKVSTLNMPKDLSFIEAQAEMFNMKIKDLVYYAKRLSEDFDLDFANKMMTRFKLDPKKKFKQLSFGMKTMLSTLLSLSSRNSIIILDEPVLGFDAIMRERFYQLLFESLQEHPRTIIVSTHIIDEIAKVAEKIIVIDQGKIIAFLDIAEIDDKAYSITGKTADIETAVKGLNVFRKSVLGDYTTAYIFDKRIKPPSNCTIQMLSLQDYFINLVGGEDNV